MLSLFVERPDRRSVSIFLVSSVRPRVAGHLASRDAVTKIPNSLAIDLIHSILSMRDDFTARTHPLISAM